MTQFPHGAAEPLTGIFHKEQTKTPAPVFPSRDGYESVTTQEKFTNSWGRTSLLAGVRQETAHPEENAQKPHNIWGAWTAWWAGHLPSAQVTIPGPGGC